VLSGGGLCDELITRPEESYRLWRVVVCDLETSKEEAKARYRAVNTNPQCVVTPRKKNRMLEVLDCLLHNYCSYLFIYILSVEPRQLSRWKVRVGWFRVRIKAGTIFFLQNVQSDSESNPLSCVRGPGVLS
jgi:hypothetical protein